MLEREELAEVAAAFGVTEAQVRRDHLISHVLAAIATLGLPLTFFGGTALARTHLADPGAGARMSEDIDLYSPRRRAVAEALDERLPPMLRREYPGVRWEPPLTSGRAVDPGQLVSRDGSRVRIQVLNSQGDHQEFAGWPTEVRPVGLRYQDLPGPVILRVPTRAAFAAMKTIAWLDRHAARDLYDLAGLARIGAIDPESVALVHRATGWRVTPAMITAPPPEDWYLQLAHQTRHLLPAQRCLTEVREAFARATAAGIPPSGDRRYGR